MKSKLKIKIVPWHVICVYMFSIRNTKTSKTELSHYIALKTASITAKDLFLFNFLFIFTFIFKTRNDYSFAPRNSTFFIYLKIYK